MVEWRFIFLANAQVVAPPPMERENLAKEPPEGGCPPTTCCASSSLWPIDIDLRKPSIGAAFVEGDTLIHLWQSHDLDSYYDMQRKLIEWGLKNGDVVIQDSVVVLQSQPS